MALQALALGSGLPIVRLYRLTSHCVVTLHCGLSPRPHSLFKKWFVAIGFRGFPEFEGLAPGSLRSQILGDYITDETLTRGYIYTVFLQRGCNTLYSSRLFTTLIYCKDA